MRLWAEERRVGTLELLLTMPITAWQAIVGKFLASWLFLLLALVLTFPGGHHRQLSRLARQRRHLRRLRRQFPHGRRLSGHQLHDLRHDPQPGRQLHRLGRHLPVPGPVRISAGDQSADADGQALAGEHGGGASA